MKIHQGDSQFFKRFKYEIAKQSFVIMTVISMIIVDVGGVQTTPSPPSQQSLTSDDIIEARSLLNQLGYWVNLDAKGFDSSLRHAMMAFQKIGNRRLTGILTLEELEVLRTAETPIPLETGYSHIEIDLTQQVLFYITPNDFKVRILHISSGSGELFTEGGDTRRAVTPIGRFKIYRKINGWRKSTLGLLYYPNYIHEGIAIHGNPSVPSYPASHGCIRIPMFAAREFSEIATIGMDVLVYQRPPLTQNKSPNMQNVSKNN